MQQRGIAVERHAARNLDANELLADCGAEVRLVPADVVRTIFVSSIRPKGVFDCIRP